MTDLDDLKHRIRMLEIDVKHLCWRTWVLLIWLAVATVLAVR